jgi:hypothetical protein
MARNKFYVSPEGTNWKVTFEQQVLSRHATKETALEAARTVAHANQPSQVLVQKQDGTFQTEWTYGDDPYPPKG